MKRRAIYQYCRERADIICLQEIHSTQKDEKIWDSQWGGKCYYSHGDSNARGVMILIKKQLDVKVLSIMRDTEGRFLALEMNIEGRNLLLGNIYGTNNDTPTFYSTIAKRLEETSENKILMGDFNITMQDKDRYRLGQETKKNSKQALLNIMEEYMLEDTWRARNDNKLHFSWQRRNPRKQASRIDYALISQGLSSFVENITYIPSVKTDHQAMFVAIKFKQAERGSGYWKLNCSMLRNQEFVEALGKEIDLIMEEYKYYHPCTRWELLKKKIAEKAKQLCRRAGSEKKLAISQMLEKVEEMEDNMELSSEQEDILARTKAELNELVDDQAKAIMFRCKVQWTELGEKSSRYFYNLEKARYNAKTCQTLLKEGEKLTSDTEILAYEKEFYQKLYSKDEQVHFSIPNIYSVAVSEIQREMQNRELEQEEIALAIKQLNNNKTPGKDGLPVEFYKLFYKKIGRLLKDVYECCAEEGKLHQTAMNGILNLIPKPGKDPRDINNLRPITLLNVDYKIIEKVLANRMEEAMHDIIHMDQKGFMKGRRISTNIRKILDLIQYADQEKIEALILSLDYKKCFDMISFDAIIGALEFFDFGKYIIDWTKILYTGYHVEIQNNGKFSERINILRSVHQGGVNSVNYFLLVAEILALTIRGNEEIKGIPVRDIINLLTQFADDMDVAMLAEQSNLDEVLGTIEWFKEHTGFTINYDKTKILRIGSLKKTDAKLITQRQVSWTNEPINILGVWTGHCEEQLLDINYKPIVEKAKNILRSWRNRDLSLIGKISIINTLIGSLFVYRMTVLPNLPEVIIKELEDEFRRFIWNGKKAKIALEVLQRSKEEGGLRLVDLRKKEKALKISWIQILEEDEKMANLAYEAISPILRQWIFDCNLNHKDVKWLKIGNKFWEQVLKAWCEIHYAPDNKQDQVIWYNSNIRIENKPFLWVESFKKGLWKISQLYEQGRLISIRLAEQKFGLSFIQLHALISSIPKGMRQGIEEGKRASLTSLYAELLDKKHLTGYVYNLLLREQGLCRSKGKWELELDKIWSNKAFNRNFRNIYLVSNIAKYRSFQYRLLHRALVLNTHLYVWKMRENDLCTFCGKSRETLLHLFTQCEIIQELWLQSYEWVKRYTPGPIKCWG